MTVAEKAKELVDKYKFVEIANYTSKFEVKQCALIAVDEVLETLYSLKFGNAISDELEYFENVKQEIEKL